MRAVIQRVRKASVEVDGDVIGKINNGFLIFLGVCNEDTVNEADKLLSKIIGLRIFKDENDKTNLSLRDVNGELLIISQFTLYADCRKGNRPSFINAGNPEHANKLYEYFVDSAKKENFVVQTGSFGAEMKVDLCNDGPFTVVLDCVDGKIV